MLFTYFGKCLLVKKRKEETHYLRLRLLKTRAVAAAMTAMAMISAYHTIGDRGSFAVCPLKIMATWWVLKLIVTQT